MGGWAIASTYVGIVVPDKSMGIDITANKVNTNTRGIEIGTGNLFNVSGNDLIGHILATGSSEIAITNNVIRDAYQHNLEIVNCTKFSVQDNTVMRTSANYGGGWGIRYSGSTGGSIKNNTYISIVGGAGRVAELDSGGNTSVTVSGAVVL